MDGWKKISPYHLREKRKGKEKKEIMSLKGDDSEAAEAAVATKKERN